MRPERRSARRGDGEGGDDALNLGCCGERGKKWLASGGVVNGGKRPRRLLKRNDLSKAKGKNRKAYRAGARLKDSSSVYPGTSACPTTWEREKKCLARRSVAKPGFRGKEVRREEEVAGTLKVVVEN